MTAGLYKVAPGAPQGGLCPPFHRRLLPALGLVVTLNLPKRKSTEYQGIKPSLFCRTPRLTHARGG